MPLLGRKNKTKLKSQPLGFKAVRVVDIILNINHPRAEEYGGYDAIGTIFYQNIYDQNQGDNTRLTEDARPYFTFVKQYPLVNEIVLILNGPTKYYNEDRAANHAYYLPNINIWNHQHNNALADISYYIEGEEGASPNYSTVGGQIIRTAEGDNSVEIPLGQYFKENLSIQPLLPFEGDTIIEGRFGNSIRFGATALNDETPDKDETAYSTKGETGDPITIIRNGAIPESNGWEHRIENINTDHSTIYLTSNQVLPNMEIVSTHWQSWLAKYDELEVSNKDEFDSITEGFEVETLEPEEPEATADQELEEATEEDIAAEEELNEDPEDCVECGEHEGPFMIAEGEEFKYSYEVDNEVSDDEVVEENNQTPPPPDPPQNEPEVQPLPPDFGPEKDIVETYRGFDIERSRGRFDGYYVETYEIVSKSWPAGSAEEYVDYEYGGLGSQYGYDTLKESIDEAYEDYEDGYRIGD